MLYLEPAPSIRRVETDRLLLRPLEPADAPAYAAIFAKPRVIRYLPGGEARAGEAETRARKQIATDTELWSGEPGFGPWGAIEKQTGRLLGHIGLCMLPDLGGMTEIQYMLDDTAWGKGYATEGALAARDAAFERLGHDYLIALAMPDNQASMHVMEKIGMNRQPGFVEAFGYELVCYDLRKEPSGAPAQVSER